MNFINNPNSLLDIDITLFMVYNYDNKFRLGNDIDGGYVLCDLDITYDCFISGGISNNDDFSVDFLNKYNINKDNCYGIDGTVNNLPDNLIDRMTFIKKNIGSSNDNKHTDLIEIINNYNNIFIKMDIEGGEWPWLLNMNIENLNKISQMVIELHGITNISYHGLTFNSFNSDYYEKVKYLQKIKETHYLVHAHGNNADMVNDYGIPNVIELTYINKKFFNEKPKLNNIPLPIKYLDFPNDNLYPDINLNFFPFTILEN